MHPVECSKKDVENGGLRALLKCGGGTYFGIKGLALVSDRRGYLD